MDMVYWVFGVSFALIIRALCVPRSIYKFGPYVSGVSIRDRC